MRERLTMIGAELRVESQRGKGTVLTVTLPLPEGAASRVEISAPALRQA
jgi:signal transduction histidine kinase